MNIVIITINNLAQVSGIAQPLVMRRGWEEGLRRQDVLMPTGALAAPAAEPEPRQQQAQQQQSQPAAQGWQQLGKLAIHSRGALQAGGCRRGGLNPRQKGRCRRQRWSMADEDGDGSACS